MSEHQQRLEDLKASSKMSLLAVGAVVVFLIFVYVVSFHKLNIAPEGFGQFGDYIGGLLNPLVGFLALLALWKTASIQTEILKEQIEREQKQREQDRLEAEEKKQNDIFNRGYEAYLRCLQTLVCNLHGREYIGKPALKAFFTETNSTDFQEISRQLKLREVDRIVDIDDEISRIFDKNKESLSPYFRLVYSILKSEYIRTHQNKYQNIVFFRSQLTNEELMLISINILFHHDGAKLAEFVKYFGLLKHLSEPQLRSFISDKYGTECFGRKFTKAYQMTN